ncbi:AAA family ATPase [Streptomyces luteogriseus]|uniref:AAA family ATPase n=2 Tax=Streptomyces luteogriseus TaxID=68233 RepID=UPI0035E418A1
MVSAPSQRSGRPCRMRSIAARMRSRSSGVGLMRAAPGSGGREQYGRQPGTQSTPARSAPTRRSNREDDAGDQSLTPAAVAEQNILLEMHPSEGTTLYLASTNVESRVRAGIVQRARRHGRPIVALRFLPHLDTCRVRNRTRPATRQVPDDILAWQHSLARAATPQTLITEGFTAAHDIATPL